MPEKTPLDEEFPNLKKYVTIPFVFVGLFILATSFVNFGIGRYILGIVIGLALLAIGIGFWFNARWARFISGITLLLLGLYTMIAPIVHVISAGTVGFQKYDPFENIPPLLMVLIIFIGLAIVGAGVGILIYVFEKKDAPKVQESKVCPYCGANVLEKNYEHHITIKCPKRGNFTK